jgi:hypothetical protein
MVADLEVHMGLKRTAVIEVAIRQLHRKEVGAEKLPKKPKKTT